MTEQKPERTNGVDRRPWKISPKTPIATLRESHTINIYNAMTLDVNNNVRELATGIDWREVIWARACDIRDHSYVINSITEGFVRNLRLVAEQMGWGMSTPEVVYMSGLHFACAIDKVNADRVRNLAELNDPKRTFVPEIRQAKIEKTQEEVKRFEGFKVVTEDALRRYAGQKLTPGWRNYVKDLQKLFNALMSGKQEEIDEAARTLSAYPERRTRVNKKSKQKNIEKNPVVQQPIPQERAIVPFVANPQPIT